MNLSDQVAQDRLKSDSEAFWLHQVHPEYDLPFCEAIYQNLKQTFVLATGSFWTDQMKEYLIWSCPLPVILKPVVRKSMSWVILSLIRQLSCLMGTPGRPESDESDGAALDQADFSEIDNLSDIQQKMKLSVLAHEGYDYISTQLMEVVDKPLTNISVKHPMACDPQVRNTEPLQSTMGELQARVSSETLKSLGIESHKTVILSSGASTEVTLNVCDDIAKGCIELTGDYRQLTGSWLQEIELGNGS